MRPCKNAYKTANDQHCLDPSCYCVYRSEFFESGWTRTLESKTDHHLLELLVLPLVEASFEVVPLFLLGEGQPRELEEVFLELAGLPKLQETPELAVAFTRSLLLICALCSSLPG